MTDTGLNKKISGVPLKWWLLGGTAAAVTVWYVYKRQIAATTVPADTGTGDSSASGYGDFSAASGGAYASNYGTPSNYGYLDQTTGQFIGVGGTTTVTGPGTNGAWTQQAAAYLIMQGYDPITVITALGKYLAGTAVTQSEYNIVTSAIGVEGLPPDGAPPLHMIPATQTPPTAKPVYAVQTHQLSAATPARQLEQRFSVAGASAGSIESALRKTVGNIRNARYMPYYTSHGGVWPAKSKIYLTVVQSEG